jgi:hypothetical protein
VVVGTFDHEAVFEAPQLVVVTLRTAQARRTVSENRSLADDGE